MPKKIEPAVRAGERARSPGPAKPQNGLSLLWFSRHSFPLECERLNKAPTGLGWGNTAARGIGPISRPIGPSDHPHTPKCNLFSRDEVLVKGLKADWCSTPSPPRHPCRPVRSLVAVTPPNPRCVDCLGFFSFTYPTLSSPPLARNGARDFPPKFARSQRRQADVSYLIGQSLRSF